MNNRSNWVACVVAWTGLACVMLLGCQSIVAEPLVEPAVAPMVHPVIEAGRQFNLVKYGKEDQGLSMVAELHARNMALRTHQDHNGFEHRATTIFGITGLQEASEICAESWPGQTMEEAAADCWKCWRQSPSHWRTANGKPALYGVAMSQGRNGIWYICIVAAWE